MTHVSSKHPRAESLRIREKLAEGFRQGLVIPEGLAAHGRGEAFDYLLGERTTPFARRAIRAASAALLSASHPVISVNGNVAALVPSEIVKLAKVTGALLEVNLFHGSKTRERKIANWLKKHGADRVYGIEPKFCVKIPEVQSNRRKVDCRGIKEADVVFVPLEDGDRTEALRKLGKFVIAVDLNPLSRTARKANITIVDNLVRAVPLMVENVKYLSQSLGRRLDKMFRDFDNEANLGATLRFILNRLESLSK